MPVTVSFTLDSVRTGGGWEVGGEGLGKDGGRGRGGWIRFKRGLDQQCQADPLLLPGLIH